MRPTIYVTFLFIASMSWSFSQTEDEPKFPTCPEMNTWPYYRYPNLNKQNFGQIKKYFIEGFSELNAQNLSDNSGIVTIQFKINCNADVGDFNLNSCDLNYIKNEINSNIADFLMKKIKNLKGWNVPIDDEGNIGNAHKFYSFRIVDGEITEILPK